MALLYVPGFMSLVIPRFGLGRPSLDDSYLARLDARMAATRSASHPGDRVTYEEASARTVAIVDEHLLGGGADRMLIGKLLRTHRVRVVADGPIASSLGGQELILTTTLLVRRMGMSLKVVAPNSALLAAGEPFAGATLQEALRSVEHELLPGTNFTLGLSDDDVNVEFALGQTASTSRTALALGVSAVAARGAVGRLDGRHDVDPAARLTALLASGIVAAQAFRSFAARVSATLGLALEKDLTFDSRCEIDLEQVFGDLPELAGTPLAALDFISAGAITHAAIYTLERLATPVAARLIEPKELDAPDLNRYMLALARHVGVAKVEVIPSRVGDSMLIEGIEAPFDEATRTALRPPAPRVAVGVDHVPSRWLAQSETPNASVVAATEGFEALVSIHSPTSAYTGCLHPTAPVDEAARTVPTISFVSFFAGVFQALLLAATAKEHLQNAQVFRVLPFACGGPVIQHSSLAVHPRCPVGCAASVRARSAA